MTWETVIGLEVHVQLATASKMFCGCAAEAGAPPNTNVCPVCLGLPGALPVPNREAVRLGVLAATALGCTVHARSVFARKNYFYPDLPKGYQISQFDQPLATGGTLNVDTTSDGTLAISITRLHLEEDAGKSLHDRIAGHTAIDLNRAGTPIAEIVSGPDLRSPAAARAYLQTLRQVLVHAGISDCSMESGSLRVDANLSVRHHGEPLGTKTEVKNMNSFANVERALSAERDRQIALLEGGGRVTQVTLTFNATTGRVTPLRSKEDADDYRYFPDPDLPPLVLAAEWIEARRRELVELPAARRSRYQAQYGLPPYDTGVLTQEPQVAEYFESLLGAGIPPKTAANWVMGEVLAAWNASGVFAVLPTRLAQLVALVDDGTVSLQAARAVFAGLAASSEPPRKIAERMGLVQVRSDEAIGAWIDAVIAAHPAELSRWRAGEVKLMGFFVGQVMKHSGGKADPKALPALLRQRLDG